MKQEITLDKLKIGETAKVISVNNTGTIRRRLLDIGLIPNTLVTAVLASPFRDPIAYRIKNALIAIRKCDSKHIVVEVVEEWE